MSIVWFDLETTGVNISSDRIIEICLIKTEDNQIIDKFESLVNPDGVLSRPEAIEKHGITNESLIDKPTFKELANQIIDFIGDSDLGGYNVLYFDIPFLCEELLRCGFAFNVRNRAVIDPFLIMSSYEPRNLGAVYKRLTGKELENAHRAESDILATIEIFQIQKERYNLPESATEIDEVVNTRRKNTVDLANKFILKEINGINEVVFSFGKWKDRAFREVYQMDRNYLDWMINKGDFTLETKLIIKKLINRIERQK